MEFKRKVLAVLVGIAFGNTYADHKPLNQIKLTKSQSEVANSKKKMAPIMLAKIYTAKEAIDEYFISEKLDGVRAYWDGKQLFTRSGRMVNAPAWFTKDFPTVPLDGELWIARENFEKVSAIVRSKNPNLNKWLKIKFMVFDLPASQEVFSERLSILEQTIKLSSSKYLRGVSQRRVANEIELYQLLNKITSQKGEGLMLHHADSLYRPGRSNGLLKLKIFEDAEAVVLRYIPGKGKLSGLMGALEVKNSSGQIFRIGSGFNLQQRKYPPKIGSRVTYRYRGKTVNQLPRFATYLRQRELE